MFFSPPPVFLFFINLPEIPPRNIVLRFTSVLFASGSLSRGPEVPLGVALGGNRVT